MIIIGITGTLGAGKGTVVEYMKKKYDFSHFSARDFITQEIVARGLPVNRDTMTEVSNSLRAKYHPGYIIEQLYAQAIHMNHKAIIESVRTKGEIDALRGEMPFYLFAVDANPRTRFDRIQARKSSTDFVTYEKFLEDEAREMESDDPTKQNLKYCIEHSDYVFVNNGTIEELNAEVDMVMERMLNK